MPTSACSTQALLIFFSRVLNKAGERQLHYMNPFKALLDQRCRRRFEVTWSLESGGEFDLYIDAAHINLQLEFKTFKKGSMDEKALVKSMLAKHDGTVPALIDL